MEKLNLNFSSISPSGINFSFFLKSHKKKYISCPLLKNGNWWGTGHERKWTDRKCHFSSSSSFTQIACSHCGRKKTFRFEEGFVNHKNRDWTVKSNNNQERPLVEIRTEMGLKRDHPYRNLILLLFFKTESNSEKKIRSVFYGVIAAVSSWTEEKQLERNRTWRNYEWEEMRRDDPATFIPFKTGPSLPYVKNIIIFLIYF